MISLIRLQKKRPVFNPDAFFMGIFHSKFSHTSPNPQTSLSLLVDLAHHMILNTNISLIINGLMHEFSMYQSITMTNYIIFYNSSGFIIALFHS